MMKWQTENSKLGKIAHFSKTCPHRCYYCYGIKSQVQYEYTRANIRYNGEMIKANEMPAIPTSRNVARLFSVYGDFESVEEINKVIRLAGNQPNKIIYGYTKSWTLGSDFINRLRTLKNMSNVVLRFSVDTETGQDLPNDFTKAGIITGETNTEEKHFVCKFNNKEHKMYKLQCDSCRICFKKELEHLPVYFHKH